jgi:hypothetical protein
LARYIERRQYEVIERRIAMIGGSKRRQELIGNKSKEKGGC